MDILTADQLMIDDLVFDKNNNLIKISSLDIEGNYYKSYTIDVFWRLISGLKPIQISKEILKKNGFVDISGGDFSWNLELGTCDVVIFGIENFYIRVNMYSPIYSANKLIIDELPIKYIHEVQHIFKNLKIKKEWVI